MNRYDKLRNIGVLLLCLLLAAVVLYSGFRFLEATVFLEDEEQSSYVSKTIEKDGIKYFPKQDMETMHPLCRVACNEQRICKCW